jgi:hypothetical protein
LKASQKSKRIAQGSMKAPGSAGQSSMMTNDTTRLGTAAENLVTCLNKGPQWTKQMRATDYEAFSGKKVGFDGTSPRFNSN